VVTFENSPLFSHLGSQDLERLRRVARAETFAAGQEIFREGSPGDGLYLLSDGLVEISVVVGAGRQVFSQIVPGDFFGEMAVLDDQPRSACAVAKKPSIVNFIPRAEIRKLLEDSSGLALAFLREVSHRLREFNHQYLREVVQAERLAIIGRFSRSIVHDLKNPLNIIGLTAEMAGMSQLPQDAREKAVTTIRQQVDRISELVGDILDFTQGAPPELVLPTSNYGDFIQQVIEELRAEVALKNVSIELSNTPPSVPLIFNPKRLRRVFHNLAQNATEAMAEGGRVTLRFELSPTEVTTEFEDSGPGVAPEIAGHLFEAFVTHGKIHGTGLGLSICKRILEDHRGWIKARHEKGRGAIFVFGLPRPSEPAPNGE
jgi:signal transduction histidine kinase